MGGGSRPDGQKTVWKTFFSPKLFYSFQRDPIFSRMGWGVNFFQGRVQMLSIETHITCDFPGRFSLSPNLDPHMGSPDAAVCLQNHGLSKFK